MLCPVSVFATDVTGGETCDTNVLNTDTGPVNLRAEFEPETIDLRWYNSNTLLNVTSTNSNDCTYDAPINLPTNPVKPGYKFKGWKVVPQYDFSTLLSAQAGTYAYSKNKNSYDEDLCLSGTGNHTSIVDCTDYDYFKDLNQMEWKTSFNYGTIYGMGLCSSSTSTSVGATGNPNSTDGKYCWCKATGYIASNTSLKNKPLNFVPWVFVKFFTATTTCHAYCADWCSFQVMRDNAFRSALFGQSDS